MHFLVQRKPVIRLKQMQFEYACALKVNAISFLNTCRNIILHSEQHVFLTVQITCYRFFNVTYIFPFHLVFKFITNTRLHISH